MSCDNRARCGCASIEPADPMITAMTAITTPAAARPLSNAPIDIYRIPGMPSLRHSLCHGDLTRSEVELTSVLTALDRTMCPTPIAASPKLGSHPSSPQRRRPRIELTDWLLPDETCVG